MKHLTLRGKQQVILSVNFIEHCEVHHKFQGGEMSTYKSRSPKDSHTWQYNYPLKVVIRPLFRIITSYASKPTEVCP